MIALIEMGSLIPKWNGCILPTQVIHEKKNNVGLFYFFITRKKT